MPHCRLLCGPFFDVLSLLSWFEGRGTGLFFFFYLCPRSFMAAVFSAFIHVSFSPLDGTFCGRIQFQPDGRYVRAAFPFQAFTISISLHVLT